MLVLLGNAWTIAFFRGWSVYQIGFSIVINFRNERGGSLAMKKVGRVAALLTFCKLDLSVATHIQLNVFMLASAKRMHQSRRYEYQEQFIRRNYFFAALQRY